jgi:hypothetical protein
MTHRLGNLSTPYSIDNFYKSAYEMKIILHNGEVIEQLKLFIWLHIYTNNLFFVTCCRSIQLILQIHPAQHAAVQVS